jgi:hypothetical protein
LGGGGGRIVLKTYTFTFCLSLAAPDSILSLSKAVVSNAIQAC